MTQCGVPNRTTATNHLSTLDLRCIDGDDMNYICRSTSCLSLNIFGYFGVLSADVLLDVKRRYILAECKHYLFRLQPSGLPLKRLLVSFSHRPIVFLSEHLSECVLVSI